MNNLQPREQEQVGTVRDRASGTSEERIGRSGPPSYETGTAGPENGQPEFWYIAPDLRPLAFPVTDLRPDPANARAHGERDIAAVAASLRAHGQCEPIVAKRTYCGLLNVVQAGHGRLQAAIRLGWSHVAVSWFEGSDDEAREYAIRANRTAELSQWNPDALAALQADGCVDLTSLGWSDIELADLLHDAAPVPKFQPEAPAHRLDELADNTTCPNCGHRFHREAR